MKKFLAIIVLGLLWQVNATADFNGQGDIKLSLGTVKNFEKYLSTSIHNKSLGAQRAGRGLLFLVTADGIHSTYRYCPQGKSCQSDEVKAINDCRARVKKSAGKKLECRIFANQRKIVWNNINKEVPKDVNVKEFLDKLGLVSNEKPPSNLDEEQRKTLKSLLDAGIMSQKEFDEAIKATK